MTKTKVIELANTPIGQKYSISTELTVEVMADNDCRSGCRQCYFSPFEHRCPCMEDGNCAGNKIHHCSESYVYFQKVTK